MSCFFELVGVLSTDEALAGIGLGLGVTALLWWRFGLFKRRAAPREEK